MKKNLINVFIIFFVFVFQFCKNTTEPPVIPPTPPEVKVSLSTQNVSCTELWINIKLENFTLPVNIKLNNDNMQLLELNNVNSNDTVVYVDSLLPNKLYDFTAIAADAERTDTSSIFEAKTLDTTTHNFSYQTFELGDPTTGNSSILWDVDIINENNIWAVGEIYEKDSLGNTRSYNAAHWDGTEWQIKRILYLNGYAPMTAVYAFSESDIWFGIGYLIHWDGNSYNEIEIPDWHIRTNKIWGTSSNDLYVAGNNGNIAYYNGSSWSSIETGTELDLTDIYGNNNGEIYSSGVNVSEAKGVLLKGNSNQFNVMINSEIISENELFSKLYGILATVWIDENNTVYTGGNLLFRYKNNSWDYVRSLPENYIGGNPGTYYRGFIASIRGNGSNDYIIAGDRNTLRHFNGVSWEQLGLPYDPQSPIVWRSVKMKGSTAVAVGDKGSNAFIILLNK